MVRSRPRRLRRLRAAFAATFTGVALLFVWPTSWNRTPSAGPLVGGAVGVGALDAFAAAPSPGAGAARPVTPAAGGPSATEVSGTFTGAPVAIRRGDVQVRVTLVDGVLTSAQAVRYPGRDDPAETLNTWAVPILEESALAAQGSGIDVVTGATLTSEAYARSLQDALDQAHR